MTFKEAIERSQKVTNPDLNKEDKYVQRAKVWIKDLTLTYLVLRGSLDRIIETEWSPSKEDLLRNDWIEVA